MFWAQQQHLRNERIKNAQNLIQFQNLHLTS